MSAEEYDETEYHGFKQPLLGAGNYTEYLNDNIEAYDDKIPNSGDESDRPSSGTPGRLFVNMDQDTIELDTGDEWTVVGGVEDETFTITAGDGLTGGGVVALGGGTTLSIDEGFSGDLNADNNETITGNWTIDGDWTIDGSWTFNGNWLFDATTDITTGTEVRWGADGGFSLFREETGADQLNLTFDKGGTSEMVIMEWENDGKAFHHGSRFEANDFDAHEAYQFHFPTDGNESVLKRGDEGLENDGNYVMLTNHSENGDVGIATNDGTTGGETKVLDIPSGASPTPDWKVTPTVNGDHVVYSSSGEYEIQKDGTDGAGVINFKTS